VGKFSHACCQCGGKLSIHAEMCPRCGAPFLYARGPSGLFWAVLVVVLIVFALIVCLRSGNIPPIGFISRLNPANNWRTIDRQTVSNGP
jgi:hypothetical protein